MTDEERRILIENNIMLKAIIKRMYSDNELDDFIRNVLANMVAN